jgi:hypothetical protein
LRMLPPNMMTACGNTQRERAIYSKLKDDVEFRKTVAENIRLGFEIPTSGCPMAPNVPKIAVGDVQEVAVSC